MKPNLHLKLFALAILLPILTSFAQEPVNPNGKFATVNGAKIYYEEYGQGEPLFLLHGFSGTTSAWSAFIPEYAKKIWWH